ncbi:hypothetical protein Bca4012_011584 [Brassica carinata]|uniref:KIB1-4 beta-propeller domain-containing protein n=1 Tax=Brassica carinata TaxID=52824 RepID=A0A8X7S5M9_BRACI|nr:hypothetical protein Bca52824_036483 [Brassica carinata]
MTLSESLGLMLFPKEGGCMLFNPKEGKIERKLGDFPGCRFLANSGNWWLVLDSGCNLSIVDVFSKETIHLPPLESIRSSNCFKRVGDKRFLRLDSTNTFVEQDSDADDVRGLLWVDEGAKDYVVVWFFDREYDHDYTSFCKKGDTHYTDIPLFYPDNHWFKGLSEMVLTGYSLYITTSRRFVRVLDLSGSSFKEITRPFPMLSCHESCDSSIAVTTSGQVLLVESDPWNRTWFRVYKKNPDLERPDSSCHTVLEVDSLGGEALLLDLGVTVPANLALGIEPDSIYFTRHYRPSHWSGRDLDICVYNLASKSFNRFSDLDFKGLTDARWFLPGN